MTKSGLKIGFIGLGVMGAPMAGHLLAAGHLLFVHTHGRVPQALADGGATVCTTSRGVAERADIVFVMVPDTPDVEQVLFGEYGVASGLARGRTVVDCSSIDPIATRRFAERIRELGCDYLDAPVSGGEVGAKAATLSIMAGGDPMAFERVQPLLALMGKNVTLVGNVGDGQVCKVANQIIVALNIAAVAEALVFAAKAGADPARVRQDVHGERMVKRTFEPGFRIALHQKDLNLALQGARALGVALPQTAIAAQLMQVCAAQGLAQADHSALVRALETLAQHTLDG
jgi:2-hydroxy-3-oxopropionate reductase